MTPASITQWLQQPNREVPPATLEELLTRYPYFTPLQYMSAAAKQKDGETVQLTGHPDLYRANRLLFYQMMEQATTVTSIEQEELIFIPEEIAEETTETSVAPPNEIANVPLETQDNIVEEQEEVSKVEVEGETIIEPIFTENYFLHQGIPVPNSIPAELDEIEEEDIPDEEPIPADPKSLMVVMSFTDWLMHYKSKTQKEKEEEEDRKAMKHMWQKEKLAAALEEEDDEIPEGVFEMAVNSISKEDGLVSESLAEILAKQGKLNKAIDMYRKLSLRNPQKSAYFAQQIAAIQKKSE